MSYYVSEKQEEQTDEVWRDIPTHPGIYQVSSLGRVRSLTARRGKCKRLYKGRILKTSFAGRYVHVVLSKEGHLTGHYIHRLVLEAFVGPCPDGMAACHYPDQNPENNRVDNLRWDTYENNESDKHDHGTYWIRGGMRGEDHYRAKLNEVKVKRLLLMWNTGKYTKTQLSRTFRVSWSTVNDVVKGRSWKHLN